MDDLDDPEEIKPLEDFEDLGKQKKNQEITKTLEHLEEQEGQANIVEPQRTVNTPNNLGIQMIQLSCKIQRRVQKPGSQRLTPRELEN